MSEEPNNTDMLTLTFTRTFMLSVQRQFGLKHVLALTVQRRVPSTPAPLLEFAVDSLPCANCQ
jgi:hypothetical protein